MRTLPCSAAMKSLQYISRRPIWLFRRCPSFLKVKLPFPLAHTPLHTTSQLRTFVGLPGLRAYMVQHHEWETPTIFDLVDWPVFHAATLATSFLKRLFVIKWIHSFLPFQRQQYRYKQRPSASCPSTYGCTEEDWKHLCSAGRRVPHSCL
jgi:hypothetical protein